MTAAIYDFDRFTVPPAPRGGRTPPRAPIFLPLWRGLLTIVRLFRSAPSGPEQSRPASSPAAARDGGAPPRRVTRIRPAPAPLTLADYAPKPVTPPVAVDIDAIAAELRAMLETPPAPLQSRAETQVREKAAAWPGIDVDSLRDRLCALPRARVRIIAAAIGAHPGALWGFALGAAA